MFRRMLKRLSLGAAVPGVVLTLAGSAAHGQYFPYGPPWRPYPVQGQFVSYPSGAAMLGAANLAVEQVPQGEAGGSVTTPQTPQTPQGPRAPSTQPQPSPEETSRQAEAQPQATEPSPGEAQAVAATGETTGITSSPGYIDSAIPFTHFRLRFDAAYDDNRPDRAEFFYPECGCNTGMHGPGPNKPESRVDYQEISSYLELALNNRFSGFVEVPVRFLNPQVNDDASGLGDMNAGAKFAVIASPDTFLTGQLRVWFPTGEAHLGLGNSHTALEPAVLGHQQMGRFALDGELRDWIPLNTSNEFMGHQFAGNVLRYGVGFSYLALNAPRFRVTPVVEFVGWTVLNGEETEIPSLFAANQLLAGSKDPRLFSIRDASGDTIVNAKVGVRFGFGSFQETGFLSGSDLYVGYGRALTGDVWYKDILRVEYRVRF